MDPSHFHMLSAFPSVYRRIYTHHRYLDLQCLATDSQKHHSALSRVDLHNTKAFPVAALARASTLESSQIDAIKSMLTQPVALIQGPPGTGKVRTYVGR